LITGDNGSFFLNELDGFAANQGIITLATTNHPERLDPAILDRPSRFDMKYHFELPGFDERRDYLGLWNDRLVGEMRLTVEELKAVAEATDGFSFAYLKELILSSIMRWMTAQATGSMPAVMSEQVGNLRQQMRFEPAPPRPLASPGDLIEDDQSPF
jgi:AAA+ superfamily predicted ATPase